MNAINVISYIRLVRSFTSPFLFLFFVMGVVEPESSGWGALAYF